VNDGWMYFKNGSETNKMPQEANLSYCQENAKASFPASKSLNQKSKWK